MIDIQEFICVTCPVGCNIRAEVVNNQLVAIHGQSCQRGEAFVQEELRDARRMLTTTVQVVGGTLPLLPVRTASPIPKRLLLLLASELRRLQVQAPVEAGQPVLPNALGTGVDVIATRGITAA
ncbi:MAG: DUF1667 domain-containing protein [Anaerolineae bacterium]|jgi:CxxC motif-containing protein|nr:DUF1667 domain-containing protein [Chloroflexota bacterium]